MLVLTRRATVACRSRRGMFSSALRKGQEPEDIVMGSRAADRTNKMLDKIGSMYVSGTVGYSKKYADSYGRVFGDKTSSNDSTGAAADNLAQDCRTVEFGEGPLGMEIEWSTPPVVTNVLPGSAAEANGMESGHIIVEINGKDATVSMPDFEIEDHMTRRPLQFQVSKEWADKSRKRGELDRVDAIRRCGVTKIAGVISKGTSKELLDFVFAERDRAAAECTADPTLVPDRFNKVQMQSAGDGAPLTRWDMRLPVVPAIFSALQEMLSGGRNSLGSTFESLCGGLDAELWELGVFVSEPGAVFQHWHCDAPARCLFTAFVALQDVTTEMGPTHFLLGTHTELAHKQFQDDPSEFLEREDVLPTVALANAGDAVVYDARVLHCGGPNTSGTTRAMMYLTFRHKDLDPVALGIEQHSIRKELSGRFRLKMFRR